MKNKQVPLILWGGVDISPHWYNESPHPKTQSPDLRRDESEFMAVSNAVFEDRPVIGVCRGAQLLCVYNGGRLHQHVPSHVNNSHQILTFDDKIFSNVAADHHQVMIPEGDFIIYATEYNYWNVQDGLGYDEYSPEVVYWHKTRCLAVQPHPEWMEKDHPFNIWLNDLIKDLFHLDEGVF